MGIEILSFKLEKELKATIHFTNTEGQKVKVLYPDIVHEDMFKLLKELSRHVIRYFKLMGAAVNEKENDWTGVDLAFHDILMGKVKPYQVNFGGREEAEAVAIVSRHYQDDNRTTILKTPNIVFAGDGYPYAAALAELCDRIKAECEFYTQGKNSKGISMDFGEDWGYAKPKPTSHRIATSQVAGLLNDPPADTPANGQESGMDEVGTGGDATPETQPSATPNPTRLRLEGETLDELKILCKTWGVAYVGKSHMQMVDALVADNYVYP